MESHSGNGDFVFTIMEEKIKKILIEEYGYDLPYDSHVMNKLVADVIEATKKSLKVPKFNFRKSLIDYGFSPNLVDDWIAVRKTKRATNTKTAFDNFIKELELRNKDRNKILEIIVTQSWSGFKWKWYDNLNKQDNVGKQSDTNERKQSVSNLKSLAETILDDYSSKNGGGSI